jgi:hypothetical protein
MIIRATLLNDESRHDPSASLRYGRDDGTEPHTQRWRVEHPMKPRESRKERFLTPQTPFGMTVGKIGAWLFVVGILGD